MEELIGANKQVRVYESDIESFRKNIKYNELFSFRYNDKKQMSYGDFLKNVKNEDEAGLYSLKEDRRNSENNSLELE